MDESTVYDELLFYTLAHPDQAFFIHQYAVDAFTLQTANEHTKDIALVYALIGVFLAVEKGVSGREVQLEHMRLSRNKTTFPKIILPDQKGDISIHDVLNAPPGEKRDAMIKSWCKSIWNAYASNRDNIIHYYEASFN